VSDAVENLVKKYGFGVKIVAPEIWSTRNGNIRTDHLPRSLLRIVRGQSFLQELQARYPDELSLSASTLRPLARSRGYYTFGVDAGPRRRVGTSVADHAEEPDQNSQSCSAVRCAPHRDRSGDTAAADTCPGRTSRTAEHLRNLSSAATRPQPALGLSCAAVCCSETGHGDRTNLC